MLCAKYEDSLWSYSSVRSVLICSQILCLSLPLSMSIIKYFHKNRGIWSSRKIMLYENIFKKYLGLCPRLISGSSFWDRYHVLSWWEDSWAQRAQGVLQQKLKREQKLIFSVEMMKIFNPVRSAAIWKVVQNHLCLYLFSNRRTVYINLNKCSS